MKKFISIALLLALCLSLFAGCQEKEPAKTNLDNAIDYIFNMYKGNKDEDIKFTNDKEVIAVVVIDGTSYNVNWTLNITSGDKNAVAITDGSTANFKKVDLADVRESETKFTLTAEVKDGSESKTVTFNCVAPEAKPTEVTDEKITIYFPTDNVYVTGVQYDYTSSSSGTTKAELVLSEKKSDAVVFTIQEKDGGKVSFVTNDGKYLFCDGTNVKLVAEEGEFTLFTLEAAEGGSFIKSNAFYNDNPEKPQYLEVYSGYLTCYGMSADKANIYTFAFHDAKDAGTTTPDTGKDEPETTEPAAPSNAQLPPVEDPVAGTAYKFGIIQVNIGKTLYLTGESDGGRFLPTTEDKASAVDFFAEASGDGFKFYFEKDGAKNYLVMALNDEGKAALSYGADGTVFKLQADIHAWVADLDGTPYYPGSYNEFETLSASKTSYINADNAGVKQFPAGLFN